MSDLDEFFTKGRGEKFFSVSDAIDYYSRKFLALPYCAGAQGEGEIGQLGQAPLYRFDCFDCVTYVNNVLALAFSKSQDDFLPTLLTLNYYESHPVYENRFHFMSCDWNVQNQKNGFVKNITAQIAGRAIKSAVCEIDKPNWYRYQINEALEASLRNSLKALATKSKKVEVHIDYLPLSALFNSKKQADLSLFSKIPHGAIVEIVRPSWDLRNKIGTCMHVSHLGFAIINSKNQLQFRHASSERKKVVEVSLVDYLKNCLNSETIKGICVLVPYRR